MRPSIETRLLSSYTGGAEHQFYSISQLARAAKAAYPHAHAAITGLVDKGVLEATIVGRSLLCTPNLASERCRLLLCEANLGRKERLLASPNLRNLDAEVRRLAVDDHRLVAAILKGERLRFVVTDHDCQRDLLRRTSLVNISFSTPDELRQELLRSPEPLTGATPLLGYDRLLLLLLPIQRQMGLNHSALFRGRKEVRV